VLDLARTIVLFAGSASEAIFTERPIDHPEARCPDISRARSLLGWAPRTPLADGLPRTIEWARETWPPEPSALRWPGGFRVVLPETRPIVSCDPRTDRIGFAASSPGGWSTKT
jgi:hypothetical protein